MTLHTIAPSTGSGSREFFPGFPTGSTGTKELLATATAVIENVHRVIDPLSSVIGTLLYRDVSSLTVSTPVPAAIAAALLERLSLTPQSEHLDRCFEEIKNILGASLVEATAAAGIDRGTVYAWRRRGSAPRPGTVGAVLRLHGLVTSAAAAAGEEGARAWFRSGKPSPLDMLIESRGDAAAVNSVARALRRDLTGPPVPPPNLRLAATVGDGPPRPLR